MKEVDKRHRTSIYIGLILVKEEGWTGFFLRAGRASNSFTQINICLDICFTGISNAHHGSSNARQGVNEKHHLTKLPLL